jgi:hypothetical protein
LVDAARSDVSASRQSLQAALASYASPILRYYANKHINPSALLRFTYLASLNQNLIDSQFQRWLPPPVQVSGSGASGSTRTALDARP